jgi:pyruvate kinase
VPILALTPNIDTSRRLSLLWGAHSVRTDDVVLVLPVVWNGMPAATTTMSLGLAKPSSCA